MTNTSPTPAPGNRAVLMVFGSIALVTLLFGVFAMFVDPTKRKSSPPLLVSCAASLKTAVEQAAVNYQKETGVRVDLSFGDSQTLLANIQVTKRGDLYLSADDSYFAFARERNLVGDVILLAEQTAVIAVAQGNPKNIQSLSDLTNTAITISQAHPDADAIGKLVRAATAPSGLWMALSNRTVVFKPTVVDAANDVRLRAVDAAIVWDSKQYSDLTLISSPELEKVKAKVGVAVLRCSEQPVAALKFAKYLADPGKGLKDFEQQGFKTLNH